MIDLPGKLKPDAHAANAALVIFGLLMLEFCRIGNIESAHYVIGFSAVAFCQALLFIGALWTVVTQPSNRWTFAIILVFAAAFRLVLLLHHPFLSSDVYRYVWDGRVQAAGIN